MTVIEWSVLAHGMPTVSDMETALHAMDQEAYNRFVYGSYRRVFPSAHDSKVYRNTEARNWAYSYTKHREVLEYGAYEAFAYPGIERENAVSTAFGIAARHARLTRAGVAIDIVPIFEDFVSEHGEGQLPRASRLATTAKQVSVLLAAKNAASAGSYSYAGECLSLAEDIDDYINLALTNVFLYEYDGEGRPDATAYRAAVHRWLGRSRSSAVTAIYLGRAGVTMEDIEAYAANGITLEYALSLT